MTITSLDALQIFDSRGNPTVEVIATLEDGTTGGSRQLSFPQPAERPISSK